MAQYVSQKGQVVIPARIRTKVGIEPGDAVVIEESEGRVIITPLPKNPIQALRGSLKNLGPLTQDLLAERRGEEQREAKRPR